MALGIKSSSASGDFLPRIQYNAKAGRMYRVERTQDSAGNWSNDIEEIPIPLQLAFDMASVEVGWIKLDETGVDFQMVPVNTALPAQPSDKHKQGFRVLVYTKALGVRHFSHTAKCVIGAVDELHDAWSAQFDEHPGQVPVVTLERTLQVTTGSGAKKSTNFAPIFAITKWIPRPALFDTPTGEQAEEQPAAPPHPKPAAKPAPAMAGAGEEF